ncbi:MAG: FixH family protein [Hyphomicrobiales bacterium]
MIKEFTGKHMLLLISTFFGVIIAVNLVLAYFAVGTWTGLVVGNSYVASQHFNEELAEGRRMKKLGWRGSLNHDVKGITFRLQGKNGEALAGLSVQAMLKRPTHEQEDTSIQLVETAPGSYVAAQKLAPGIWDVDVVAVDAQEQSFRNIYRVTVPEGS